MKRLVFACVLLSCSSLIKAQQLQVKPVDSLVLSIDKGIKAQTDSWKLLTSGLKVNQSLALNQQQSYYPGFIENSSHYNMPVAVLNGNSKMPVVLLDGYDNMPVKKTGPAIIKQQPFQNLPTFKVPALLSPAPIK